MIEPETAVPVQLVILMALEQAKTQVEMLQEIAGVLQDAEIIEKLMKARAHCAGFGGFLVTWMIIFYNI